MKRIAILLLACLLLAYLAPCALAEYYFDGILAQDTSAIRVVDYGSDTQLTDEYGTYYVGNCFDNNLRYFSSLASMYLLLLERLFNAHHCI